MAGTRPGMACVWAPAGQMTAVTAGKPGHDVVGVTTYKDRALSAT